MGAKQAALNKGDRRLAGIRIVVVLGPDHAEHLQNGMAKYMMPEETDKSNV